MDKSHNGEAILMDTPPLPRASNNSILGRTMIVGALSTDMHSHVLEIMSKKSFAKGHLGGELVGR